ncbi:Nuclear receptor 2C2-associated protein OS=Danio rerio GN=nr2c2ap PE=2 SV=1 [Rhizoctonia solani AG-1 IB]|uniref:Nuclear receptor 2C2-associated protein n=1 Tax=Thanatephorus cucumeris (strain AG1-IB / isolate 7/3/14) TaxID=1108050 RepID=A0A0B7G034_THACB|nr:Nuclear receptor 2C2-associated protein OS=Danio rerio GN=nr2c2ap PE=2 SV=1 [Rhizoctonia solani AG-1 IB]
MSRTAFTVANSPVLGHQSVPHTPVPCSASSAQMSLIDSSTTIKVSSTLDKSVGKKNLIDGSPETCWTSAAGLPQTIELVFSDPVTPTQLALTFQGGFVGTRCTVYGILRQDIEDADDGSKWQSITQIYPEDINRRQTFGLAPGTSQIDLSKGVLRLRIVFEESSDFFGRITLYNLELL